MIVRDRPSGLRLFLTMRGSVLGRIWKSLLVTTVLAIFVTIAHGWDRVKKASHKPHFLMDRMGDDLRKCIDEGRTDGCLVTSVDATLSALVSAGASCERIRGTPIPFSYTLLLHRTAYLYCFLLPFGLVDSIGFMTPFVVAIVAYTLFGLDALGDEIEEPFGISENDLPLETICRTIEINLRESLGEDDIPKPLAPVNYQLK